MKKKMCYYFWKPPNSFCGLARLEKKSSPPPVGGDVKPDLPIPIARPM